MCLLFNYAFCSNLFIKGIVMKASWISKQIGGPHCSNYIIYPIIITTRATGTNGGPSRFACLIMHIVQTYHIVTLHEGELTWQTNDGFHCSH